MEHSNPIEERIDAFRVEWTDYIKNRLTENHRYIHLWRAMMATSELTRRMTRMANKYFRGILTTSALYHLNVSVAMFVSALSAFHVGMPRDAPPTVEAYHAFAEQYFREACEHMYCWNWPLTEKDPAALQAIGDDPVDPPYDPEANHGFPGFIHFSVGDSSCECDYDSEGEGGSAEGGSEAGGSEAGGSEAGGSAEDN